VPTSPFDILTQKAPTQTSLTEEGRKNPVIIGVACTVLFHILLFIVAKMLPVDVLSGTHPNLDAIAARKNKVFDFQLERLPEAEVQPDPVKFVETNPDAPTNEPDKTANVSNRNQQTAQEVAATEIDPEKRPTVKGREEMEHNSAIVAGDHVTPQDAAAAANLAELQTEEQPAKQARAEQIPLSGIEKNEGKSEDGTASNNSQHEVPSNNATEYLDGTKDGKGTAGGSANAAPSSKPQPKPRLKLTQARQNILSNQIAGTQNIGVTGQNAHWSEYGEYMNELIEIIQAQWYSILEDSKIYPTPGSYVRITFKLNSEGEVTVIKVEDGAGKPGTYACLNAIQERQPYRKWSEQMIAILGKEDTMTYSFYYR